MRHKLSKLDKLLHTFREILVPHHYSLEFRAKIYTLMIMGNSERGECEFNKLETVVEEVYPNSITRQNTLILTVKEYIQKIEEPNGLGINELILDIEKSLKKERRFRKKISIERLRKFMECTKDRDSLIYQERILDFLKKLKNGG